MKAYPSGWLKRLALVAGACLAAGCAGEAAQDVAFPLDQCRRVGLTDAVTGERIRGAEDLALDMRAGRLFVSAYDRRAVERAVAKRAFSLPEGGVYRVDLADLFNGAEAAMARPLVRREDVAGGLRPHGISFDPAAGELAFINRSYQRINGKWRLGVRIERIGVNGEIFVGGDSAVRCSANDLVLEPTRSLVSFDHEACGWRAGLEDVLSLRRSGVATGGGEDVFNEAAFANGIARTHNGTIALAATRERALLILDESANGLSVERRIELPGGPDNISIAPDGDIIAAVHPSLFLIGLHRRLGLGSAPSRIVKIDPATGDYRVLVDDLQGALFDAATSALVAGEHLIAGSVTDEGLLVCQAEA